MGKRALNSGISETLMTKHFLKLRTDTEVHIKDIQGTPRGVRPKHLQRSLPRSDSREEMEAKRILKEAEGVRMLPNKNKIMRATSNFPETT